MCESDFFLISVDRIGPAYGFVSGMWGSRVTMEVAPCPHTQRTSQGEWVQCHLVPRRSSPAVLLSSSTGLNSGPPGRCFRKSSSASGFHRHLLWSRAGSMSGGRPRAPELPEGTRHRRLTRSCRIPRRRAVGSSVAPARAPPAAGGPSGSGLTAQSVTTLQGPRHPEAAGNADSGDQVRVC